MNTFRSKLKDEISTQQVEIPSSTLHFSVDDLKPSMYYQFWVVSNSVSSAGNASIIQGYRVATSRSQLNNDDHIGNNTNTHLHVFSILLVSLHLSIWVLLYGISNTYAQILTNNFRNLFYWTRSESTRRCHNSFTLFAHCQK